MLERHKFRQIEIFQEAFWRPSLVTKNAQLVEIYQAIYNSRGSEYFFYWARFVDKPSPLLCRHEIIIDISIQEKDEIENPIYKERVALTGRRVHRMPVDVRRRTAPIPICKCSLWS